MSSETREFRPYRSDERLARALEGVVLRLGELECVAGGNVLIEDRTFSQRPCTVVWAAASELGGFKSDLCDGAVDTGYSLEDLALVVVVRAGYLKRHEVAFSRPLSNLEQLERYTPIATDEQGLRRAPFKADTHGVSVEVYVALSRTVDSRPLHASHKATWLAKTTFRVRCEADNVLFRPARLDDDERRRLDLRKDTLFFVEFDSGGELTEDLSRTEVPTLWVDGDLLVTLDQQPGAPGASFIQRQMALHLITSVIHEFAREWKDEDPPSFDEISGSLVGRVARMIAGSRATPDQTATVLERMRTDPRAVVAWAESTVGLRASALKSLVIDR